MVSATGEVVWLQPYPTSCSTRSRPRAVWEGRDEVVDGWVDGGFGSEAFGSLRCVVTRANRQPAVACYVRRPGEDRAAPLAIDVLRIVDGAIAEIGTFDGSLFGWFGLPETLGAS
jgi:RNA polymerase sigma-70 factor, ECF subfamily